MALHWNIKNCKDLEEIKSKEEWGTTNTLIWLTIPVGLGNITEDNWKEFLFRIRVMEKLSGPFLHQFIPNTDPPEDGKGTQVPIYFTPKMVKKRIGLYTNVSDETRSAWMKNRMKHLLNEIMEGIEQDEKDEQKDNPDLKLIKGGKDG
jgi:hypothetical protein